MKIGPLYLFERVRQTKARWVIAALHWHWSLTWRWVLYFSPQYGQHRGFYYQYKRGRNTFFGLNTPWFGFHFSTQDNIRRP